MMSALFVVYACAEVHKTKLNLELAFNGRPTMEELIFRVEEAFEVAEDFHANDNGDAFHADHLAVYDKQCDQWFPLKNAAALPQEAQLYVFQDAGGKASDISGALPLPVLPPSATVVRHPLARNKSANDLSRKSSRRGNSSFNNSRPDSTIVLSPTSHGSPAGHSTVSTAPINDPEQDFEAAKANQRQSNTEAVFSMIDEQQRGAITLSQLRDAMLMCEMDVTSKTVGDTFDHGDQDINAAEFTGFGSAYPQIVRDLRVRLEARNRRKRELGVEPTARTQIVNTPRGRPQAPSERPPPRSSRAVQQLESSLEQPSVSVVPRDPPAYSMPPDRRDPAPLNATTNSWKSPAVVSPSRSRNLDPSRTVVSPHIPRSNFESRPAHQPMVGGGAPYSPSLSVPYAHNPHELLSRSSQQHTTRPQANEYAHQIELLLEQEGRLARELEAVRRERSMLEAAEKTARATAPLPQHSRPY